MQGRDCLPRQVRSVTQSSGSITDFPDIEPGTIISFYNGVKVRSEGDWEKPTPYKMLLDENYDIVINLMIYYSPLKYNITEPTRQHGQSGVLQRHTGPQGILSELQSELSNFLLGVPQLQA